MRQAAAIRLARWAARRHGTDALPVTIDRRRIYILPTRFGIALALLLAAMLIAGLNYNSNLGLAFAFLMTSLALVAMHHCHRNLLGLTVDVSREADACAGETAHFDFVLRNGAAVARSDIEIRCSGWQVEPTATSAMATRSMTTSAGTTHGVSARSYTRASVSLPAPRRGVYRLDQVELLTRHPFGWFRAWTYLHSPLTVFVAPAPRGDRALPAATAAVGSGQSMETRGDEDFAGLRAYEPGVSLKHMAWKVLARGGEAAVRSYSGLAAQPEWLDWSALAGLDIESRLSQLCLWVLQSERAQRPYGLRIPGTEVPPAHGTPQRAACLRALARYGERSSSDS